MTTKTRRKSSSPARAQSTPDDPVTAYARGVVSGEIIAGPHVRHAGARHLRDLEELPKRGFSWNPALADRVVRYFSTVLRLNGGEHEGRPFHLQSFQQFIVGSLFGWLDRDGARRFRMAYIETGKGSGKSPLAAGTGVYGLTADGESRAEVYSAATKRDQAMILFRDAVAMVDQSPALSSRIVKSGSNPCWNLAHLASGSFFRAIASDDSQSGPRPHMGLVDEFHEHKTSIVLDMLRAGTKGRKQALIFIITNSGFDRASPCYQMHEYATKVAAGELHDESLFAYVAAVDEDDDPLTDAPDPELGYPRSWAKANPNIGVTFQPKYLEELVHQARGMPSQESIVRRLNFCQWVDAANPWIDGDLWRACEVEDDEWERPATPPTLGLDLSGSRDLTAQASAWLGADGVVTAELTFWTPRDTVAERSRTDRVPFEAWVKQGHVLDAPGRTIQHDYIATHLGAMGEVAGLAFDAFNIGFFQQAMDRVGVEGWIYDPKKSPTGSGIMMMRHLQGFGGGTVDVDDDGNPLPKASLWMPASIKALRDLIMTGKLRVRRNPALTWNSASAVTESDPAGNEKWEKRKSTGRIDGIVALSMAVGLLLNGTAETQSVYEERGMLSL